MRFSKSILAFRYEDELNSESRILSPIHRSKPNSQGARTTFREPKHDLPHVCLLSLAHFGGSFYIPAMKTLTIITVIALLTACGGQDHDSVSSDSQAAATSQPAKSKAKAEKTPTSKPSMNAVKKPEAKADPVADYNYGAPKKPAGWATPSAIKVQHILVSFTGAVGEGRLGNRIPRTQEEAKTLVHDLVKRLRAGEDMLTLVKKHTQDSAPGIYEMCTGRPTKRGQVPRAGMVKNFGDTSFSLDVGEVGLAEYHPKNSPYGYHIVKRLE